MKLYTGLGPNPRVVKMFLAEKDLQVPMETVDIMAGDNRKGPHLVRNPAGQLPTLELDNGVMLAEIVPICEYLEEKHPTPTLIGVTPEERAVTRMWKSPDSQCLPTKRTSRVRSARALRGRNAS